MKNKNQNQNKEQIEPANFIQIGDVVVSSTTENIERCSKIALNITKLKEKFRVGYVG